MDADAGSALPILHSRHSQFQPQETPLFRDEVRKQKEIEKQERREALRDQMARDLQVDREIRKDTREAQKKFHDRMKERVVADRKMNFEIDKKESALFIDDPQTPTPTPTPPTEASGKRAMEKLKARHRYFG